jgi:hypothetical protein
MTKTIKYLVQQPLVRQLLVRQPLVRQLFGAATLDLAALYSNYGCGIKTG